MRIHELLEQSLTQYMQQFTENFQIEGLSWYNYKRPAKSKSTRMQKTAKKTSTQSRKNAGRLRSIANSAASAAFAQARQRQQANQNQQQIWAKQPTPTTPYAPIKYRKQLVRNQNSSQQPSKTPAPPSVTAKIGGIADLKNLGAQAQMILPKDQRGTPSWQIDDL